MYQKEKTDERWHKVQPLIQHAMCSENPEFLVELGEQFAVGLVIPARQDLADQCFQRALSLSPIMGGYAYGRFYFESDSKKAEQFLLRAAQGGHVPSRTLLHVLNWPKGPILKKLYKYWLYIARSPGTLFQRLDKLNPEELRLRVWRYRDDNSHAMVNVDRIIVRDRNVYFPWTRPTSTRLFCYACRQAEVRSEKSC